MKKLILPLLLLCALIVSSCCKEKVADDVEYLIFGRANYAWCPGDCYTGYKLTTDQLLADSNTYGLDTLFFEAVPLDAAKHALAVHLLDEIPVEMLTTTQTTYVCNNCADQGLFLLEIKHDGVVKRFYIDDPADNVPDYVENFVDKVRATLNNLQ